jgi:hypothetical protein
MAGIMDKIRLREFSKLAYFDPAIILRNAREFEKSSLVQLAPANIRKLRTNLLKPGRKMIDAALFCLGMTEHLGTMVSFCPKEDQDFDFITRRLENNEDRFCLIQLKELVSAELNSLATIEEIIAKLSKYKDSKDVVLVLKIHRNIHFDSKNISLPDDFGFGGFWVFSSVTKDKSKFRLWGDFLNAKEPVIVIEFAYPV